MQREKMKTKFNNTATPNARHPVDLRSRLVALVEPLDAQHDTLARVQAREVLHRRPRRQHKVRGALAEAREACATTRANDGDGLGARAKRKTSILSIMDKGNTENIDIVGQG